MCGGGSVMAVPGGGGRTTGGLCGGGAAVPWETDDRVHRGLLRTGRQGCRLLPLLDGHANGNTRDVHRTSDDLLRSSGTFNRGGGVGSTRNADGTHLQTSHPAWFSFGAASRRP